MAGVLHHFVRQLRHAEHAQALLLSVEAPGAAVLSTSVITTIPAPGRIRKMTGAFDATSSRSCAPPVCDSGRRLTTGGTTPSAATAARGVHQGRPGNVTGETSAVT